MRLKRVKNPLRRRLKSEKLPQGNRKKYVISMGKEYVLRIIFILSMGKRGKLFFSKKKT